MCLVRHTSDPLLVHRRPGGARGGEAGGLTVGLAVGATEPGGDAQGGARVPQRDDEGSEADELSRALKKLGYNMPSKQCEELLNKVDQDSDGQVSFDEFVAFFEFVPLASLGSITR